MAKKRKVAGDAESGTSKSEDRLANDREGDLTRRIERLELFEERLGVRLESLSALIEIDQDPPFALNVYGELHPRDGTELQSDVELIVVAYDQSGRIVGTDSTNFDAENFFGFETFRIWFYLPVNEIVRIRVYPKKG